MILPYSHVVSQVASNANVGTVVGARFGTDADKAPPTCDRTQQEN